MQTTILVADDERFAREGIIRILEAESDFSVIGEAYHGVQAIEMVRQYQPDVLLLDMQMPPDNTGGMLAFRTLHNDANLKTRILVLTKDNLAILSVKEEGGSFIPKSADKVLVSAVREVLEKPQTFGIATAQIYELEGIKERFKKAKLNQIDLTILSLITYETKEIAARLQRDHRYVRDRLSNNIYTKLKDQNLIDTRIPVPLWRQAEAVARIAGILDIPPDSFIEKSYEPNR